jgi:hypothetical protein
MAERPDTITASEPTRRDYVELTFENDGCDFSALRSAEAWCRARGLVVGVLGADDHVGVHRQRDVIDATPFGLPVAVPGVEHMDGGIKGSFRLGSVSLIVATEAISEPEAE